MIFEHVSDEVKRISTTDGSPLSRASTAGHWLSSDLLEMLGPKLRTHVQGLRNDLPILVLESAGADGRPGERKLVTFAELSGMHNFWTLESRLMDSLGIISRDLGKELSLGEFLHALAPDLQQQKYSPIISDAHLFRDELIESYHPVSVEFSRNNQQTAI
jgi:molecular chaperone HtpG